MNKLIWILLAVAVIVVAWQYIEPTGKIFAPTPGDMAKQEKVAVEEEDVNRIPSVPESPLADIIDEDVTLSDTGRAIRGSTVYSLGANNQIRRTALVDEVPVERTTELQKGEIGVDGSALVDGILEMSVTADDAPKAMSVLGTAVGMITFVIEEGGNTRLQGVLQMNGSTHRIGIPAVVVVEEDTVLVTSTFSVDLSARGIVTAAGTSEFAELSMQLVFVPVAQ